MKRTIFLMVLICTSFLCLAGCQKSDTNTMIIGAVNSETQNKSNEDIASITSQPPEIPAQPSVANSSESEVEVVRYPIPEDSQFHGRFTETDDAWMDAEGNIWLGDTQFTFNKDSVPQSDKVTEGSGRDTVTDPLGGWVYAPPVLTRSKMQIDNHPEEWLWSDGTDPWVTLEEFNALIEAQDSNFKLWDRQYSIIRDTPYVWWNGALAIQAYPLSSDYSDIYGVILWEAWGLPRERFVTPETHSSIHGYYKIDSDGRMNTALAVLLWRTMAVCDTFVIMDEVLTEDTRRTLPWFAVE